MTQEYKDDIKLLFIELEYTNSLNHRDFYDLLERFKKEGVDEKELNEYKKYWGSLNESIPQ